MSTSESMADALTFDDWLAREYAGGDKAGFTALVILFSLKEGSIDPLCSTFMHVIGQETRWSDVEELFAGAGMPWDAAAFFPRRSDRGGPLSNPEARDALITQQKTVDEDRLALNGGFFFNAEGQRMMVEEA